MKTVQNAMDTRRANLRKLIEQLGGPAALARLMKLSGPSYISQIVSGNRPRNRLALPIEIRQQGIAPLLIQPTAGTLHRSQPLAHLLRHL
jgi:hypothetical protein